jgi:DNA invertase Pin-like site-specific DNA recombinase
VVKEYDDAGISGSKGRNDRPGLDEMLKDAQRRRFDIVMAWAIDRLGRSLIDLLGTIQQLETCGVDLYLDQQAIDTTTPTGRLMFQITGAFAEFERSMIRQRIRAGLRRAVEAGKQLGRPKIDPALEKRIESQLRAGKGMLAIAKALGVGTSANRTLRRATIIARPKRKRAPEGAQFPQERRMPDSEITAEHLNGSARPVMMTDHRDHRRCRAICGRPLPTARRRRLVRRFRPDRSPNPPS